jgi:hypothetical protein
MTSPGHHLGFSLFKLSQRKLSQSFCEDEEKFVTGRGLGQKAESQEKVLSLLLSALYLTSVLKK